MSVVGTIVMIRTPVIMVSPLIAVISVRATHAGRTL